MVFLWFFLPVWGHHHLVAQDPGWTPHRWLGKGRKVANSKKLLGGLEHYFYDFPIILGIMIPADFHIFQWNHQPDRVFNSKSSFQEWQIAENWIIALYIHNVFYKSIEIYQTFIEIHQSIKIHRNPSLNHRCLRVSYRMTQLEAVCARRVAVQPHHSPGRGDATADVETMGKPKGKQLCFFFF